MKTPSLKARLMIGLIASLALVLAAGCVGLYWLQHELLYWELDRQLERSFFHAETRRFLFRGPTDTSPVEPPEGVAFLALWDGRENRFDRVAPAELDPAAIPVIQPAAGAWSAHEDVRLPDGRELRVLAWRIPAPPTRSRPPWRGDRRREPREQEDGGPEGSEPTTDVAEPDAGHEPPLETRPFAAAPLASRPTTDRFPGTRPAPRDRVLLLAADLGPTQASLGRWLMIVLGACAGGELLVVGVVLLVVWRGLRPLAVLTADIGKIDDSDLRGRVSTRKLPPELTPMVRQLNGLLDRLEGAFDRERAFTASAAHEFRTPLSGIRTQMEVCLRRPRRVEEYRRTLGGCLEAALALQQMVDLLLDLARLDAGQIKPAGEPVNVAELAAGQWGRFAASAAARGCTLQRNVRDGTEFETDPMMLERILANLLSNAAEYADPGTPIELDAECDGDGLNLVIRNHTHAIDRDDMGHLFDRFWRKDASRAAPGHHCGLGLAIVQRCAAALSGSVRADLAEGVLTIRVHLPRWQE